MRNRIKEGTSIVLSILSVLSEYSSLLYPYIGVPDRWIQFFAKSIDMTRGEVVAIVLLPWLVYCAYLNGKKFPRDRSKEKEICSGNESKSVKIGQTVNFNIALDINSEQNGTVMLWTLGKCIGDLGKLQLGKELPEFGTGDVNFYIGNIDYSTLGKKLHKEKRNTESRKTKKAYKKGNKK